MDTQKSYLDSKMAKLLPKPEHGGSIEPITDLDELVYTMGRVAAYASEVDLPQFQYGFYGYQQVTRAVTEQLDKGVFEDPAKMERTMPLFAERAFAPIRHHVHGDHDQINAWAPMLYRPEAKNALPSTAMVDFLGFHVIYDLPFTLQASQTTQNHKEDYTRKINIILSSVGRELLPGYIDVHAPLRQLGATKLGLQAVLLYLFNARDDAWKAFEKLEAATANVQNSEAEHPQKYPWRKTPKSVEQIEAGLGRKAESHMLSTKKTANFMIRRAGRVPTEAWDQIFKAS